MSKGPYYFGTARQLGAVLMISCPPLERALSQTTEPGYDPYNSADRKPRLIGLDWAAPDEFDEPPALGAGPLNPE